MTMLRIFLIELIQIIHVDTLP